MTSSSWRETTLGEFVRLQRGHDLPDRDRRRGTVPIMGSAGQNGFHDTAKAKGPGVVIGRSGVGSMGVVTFCATDFWPHNTVLYVTDFLGNDERFTYYLLRQLNLRRFDSGSAQASLNRNYIYPIPVRVPWPPEQRAIARILGTLDDKIELNQRMNGTLESIARAIFKAWCVDFEPVKARTAGARGFPGMPQDVFEQLPDQFLESELGAVPAGWEVVPLSELVQLLGGGTPKRKVPQYWDGRIPWFSVRDVPAEHDIWVIDTEERITEAGAENSSAKVMRAGTTIISARGTVGRLALTAVPMAMNQSCYGVQGVDGVGDLFVYFSLRHAVTELQRRTHGSVFDTITRDTFGMVDRVRPQPQVLEAFEEAVAPYLQLIRNNRFENRTLAAIRNALLPKLISGEIRVPGADGAEDGR
jgi:type I restriction enzyme, S subunit